MIIYTFPFHRKIGLSATVELKNLKFESSLFNLGTHPPLFWGYLGFHLCHAFLFWFIQSSFSRIYYFKLFFFLFLLGGWRMLWVGWYHSHLGYGCWLSRIDVWRQILNQQFQEQILKAVKYYFVGKVEIGASKAP